MTNPIVVVRNLVSPDDKPVGRWLIVWCPGCNALHAPAVIGEFGDRPDGPCWDWDGQLDPLTIFPSLLVSGPRCHSFIRNSHWEFLSDCEHELAGQTVQMVPLPDWLVRE